MNSITEQIAARIGESLFLGELCFDGNHFKRSKGKWSQLADLVLWLGTHTCLIQVKERSIDAASDEQAIRQWFQCEVIAEGIVRQLGDTHRFIRDHQDKNVTNRRGDSFLIKRFADATVINILLYSCPCPPPQDVLRQKLFRDESVGIVHIIDIDSFSNIFTRVGTPGELLSYLRFREDHLRAVSDDLRQSEKWLFGRYIACPDTVNIHYDGGDKDYEAEVDKLVDDTDSLDLRPILADLRDNTIARLGSRLDYYAILIELGWLPRAAMREFKKRVSLCYENVEKGRTKPPYRMVNKLRDCTLVLMTTKETDQEKRQRQLAVYTALGKYDSRTRRALGMLIAQHPDGVHIHMDWLYLEQEWSKNSEAEEALRQLKPFRPLREKAIYSYFVDDG